MENKKKIILSVLVVLLILAIGVTYAFFTYENGTKSDIVTGQIYMNYEETNTISLTGVFPETKAQALARTDENGVFEFTITGRNTSDKPVYYEIDLLDGGVITGKTEQSTKILPEHVMIYLERDGEVLVDGLTYLDFDNRCIYAETIPANQETNIEHKYTLRMWIDENVTIRDTDSNADYTTKEWNDSYASLKVRVVGDFEEKEVSVPINELVKSRLGNDGVVAISTTGDLYEGTGEIREYRYSGSARYCTYTSGENTYQLNVESETCPKACVLDPFDVGDMIFNGSSELFTIAGVSCTDGGGTELTSNETEPLDGDVKNYVWFNNEMWRIIGVFEVENNSGKKEELVKIIKDTPLSNYYYNELNYIYDGTTYKLKNKAPEDLVNGLYIWNDALNFGQTNMNDWTRAGLQYYLNDETEGTNSYYNSLNKDAKKMIQNVKYYLGNSNLNLTNISYNTERLNCDDDICIDIGNQETWTGKVGLMYPSDYGYAASSDNWENPIAFYVLLTNTGCQDNWMNDNICFEEWTITPSLETENSVQTIGFVGSLDPNDTIYDNSVSPVVYLKSSVMVSSGDEAYDTPYVLE